MMTGDYNRRLRPFSNKRANVGRDGRSRRLNTCGLRTRACPARALRRALIGVAAFQLLVGGAAAERVLRVTDGDSIVVESANNQVEVRIADIDAPEIDQPYGKAAKKALDDLVGGRQVRLELVGGDAYRRIVANVFVEERDVAAELVGKGFAWVRRAYAPASPLIGLEEAARHARLGLWAGKSPSPPWIWRKTGGDAGSQARQSTRQSISPECGTKTYCRQMRSCEEALAYLRECHLDTIDGDGDGIPCEKLCRYYR